MASIQKSSEKGYRIYWRLYLPDGTYKEKYKVSKSKSAIQELLPDVMKIEVLSRRNDFTAQDLLRARNLGIIKKDEADIYCQSVDNLENHRLEELRPEFETKSKVESSSLHCHTANLGKANVLERHFKDVFIGQITPELIEQFREERKKTVTNTTVNQDLKALRKYLDIAVSKGFIKENPARKLTLLREPKNRVPRCLYPEEIKTFLKGINQFKHLLHGDFTFIVLCLIYTGLRRSELRSLNPDNVKLHLRQIHVQGKGKKTRIIGIHKTLLKEFRKRVKRGGHIINPSIHESSFSRAFKTVSRKLGLPEALTLHSLRHTYISYLLEKGIPTKRVKELAGHFSLAVTDKYTHALPKKMIDEDVLDFTKV